MTIPGLAIFYGGLSETKNVLATIMQTFSITCLVSFLWFCFGYSIAFAPTTAAGIYPNGTAYQHNPFIGDYSQFFLYNIAIGEEMYVYQPKIPETVFCCYQMMFAVIAAALVCGSFADRIKFPSMLLFIGSWSLLVYCPIAHWFWHPNGFLYKVGVLDYAGGSVVHISSGVAGLVTVIVIGNRENFRRVKFRPHNMLFSLVGASLLWVGWFGFNGGSSFSASSRAGLAILVTHIAASTSGLTWMLIDWFHRGKPSVQGIISGAIAGLVSITPGSGFVNTTGGLFLGLFAAPLCYLGVMLKHKIGYDDSLDAFSVHAIGGTVGGILTGFFADGKVGGVSGLLYDTSNGFQIVLQLYGIVVTVGWSAAMSLVILLLIDRTLGLRVSSEHERIGLDQSTHGNSIDIFQYSNHSASPGNTQIIPRRRSGTSVCIVDTELGGVEVGEEKRGAEEFASNL